MLPIAYYFLQVLLCSGLMMGYYWLVLRNKRFHRYNRFYLLMVLLLSWLVPLIKIRWSHPNVQDDPQVIKLLSVVADNNTQFENNLSRQEFQWNWDYLAMGIYLLLAGVMFVGMLSALYKIYRLLKTHSCKNVEDVYLVLTQAAGTPFSFFRFIFWNESIDLQSNAGKQILVHELAHVREKHTYDKIIIQVGLIGGWFNPFFWLLKKEMDMIHEFIADDKAVKNGDTASLAQMLLTAAYPREQFALTNPFFFSSIKRRLQMLTTNERPKFSYLRRLVVLPMLAIVVILFSFRNKEQRNSGILSVADVLENVVQSVKLPLSNHQNGKVVMVADNAILNRTYTVVIDAGHGGADKGAIAADGTTESSLTLQLAKKIEEINSNNQIHIVLRRTSDVYDPVTKIAALANEQNPDLFISLHVNTTSSLANKQKGFEYFIPSKEKASDYTGSQLLATTISSAMATLQKPSLGIKSRDKGIWVLTAVKSPAVLIEIGFISNKEDLQNLKDAGYQAKLANTILNGINDYLVQSTLKQSKANGVTTDTTIPVSVSSSYTTILKLDTPHIIRNAVGGFDKASVLKFREMYFVVDGKKTDTLVLQNMQPTDIQSMDIIKGDQAIRLYGQEAANGAIVIVTKEYAKQTAPLYVKEVKPYSVMVDPSLKATNVKHGETIFTITEIPAEFPGGNPAWEQYLLRNLNSSVIKDNGGPVGKYTVVVSFLVDKGGNISSVQALNDPGYGAKAAAENLIIKGPHWKPAVHDGQLVNTSVKRTISFEVK
jgi:N-acetylmuramoyl-L-alanine amidase